MNFSEFLRSIWEQQSECRVACRHLSGYDQWSKSGGQKGRWCL